MSALLLCVVGSVNVQTYGATPNDGSDDTDSIETAWVAARTADVELYFPPGVYNISNLVLNAWTGSEVRPIRLRGEQATLRAICPQSANMVRLISAIIPVRIQGLTFDGNNCAPTLLDVPALGEIPHQFVSYQNQFVNAYQGISEAKSAKGLAISGGWDDIFVYQTTFQNISTDRICDEGGARGLEISATCPTYAKSVRVSETRFEDISSIGCDADGLAIFTYCAGTPLPTDHTHTVTRCTFEDAGLRHVKTQAIGGQFIGNTHVKRAQHSVKILDGQFSGIRVESSKFHLYRPVSTIMVFANREESLSAERSDFFWNRILLYVGGSLSATVTSFDLTNGGPPPKGEERGTQIR